MDRSRDLTGKVLGATARPKTTSGAILFSLGDRPRRKAAGLLQEIGIHEDSIDSALNGRPSGAKIIDLDEYRWMRMFDEL